ncbi:MAG: TolC family protein [Treponema sp.]|nr:TolC family protein [Treponema sp.]
MMRKINVNFFILFLLLLAAAAVHGDDNNYLTYAKAANFALASSSDLRYARALQNVREGAWRWGLRAYFPNLGLSVSENDRLQGIGADSFIKNYGINMDQLVWDGGKTSMSRRLERMDLDLSFSGLDRMASQIAESAISAYRNVLLSRLILEIKESALTALEEQRRILNEEVELGLALQLDLVDADINLADAKLDIYSLKLDLSEMERQFAELLGFETLPTLTEKIEINHSVTLPAAAAAGNLAKERNPELIETRFSITKKQAELKYASHSWIPSLRVTGNFAITGQQYPLTRYNWSVGLLIDFSSPWFQNQFAAQSGWEPPHDRSAMIQNNFNPLPNPAAGFGKKQAMLALSLERDKYNIILEKTGRMAANAVEKCALAEQKRNLALGAAELSAERCRLDELRLNLGHITRLKLMETYIEKTQREIALAQTAAALLEAERELEYFLDLRPGELTAFAAATAFTASVNETLSKGNNL